MRLENEKKRELLLALLEDNHKLKVLSREYGVHPEYVRRLLKRAQIHGVENVLSRGTYRKYSDDFKIQVVKYVENDNTEAAAAREFNLACALVHYWCKKYSEGGIEALTRANRGMLLKDDRQETDRKEEKTVHTEKEFEELQRQLRRAQMENEFLKKLDALVRERIEREKKK